ncbi:SDR family NAD(P)-dependent oxidoreductase, partial [Rosenbergiella nectarea]|uniref:SDR family NAD(P)-dependent oxidoreductase n=1 Tax=Rosenbergiella nectarea TaxID=988801 RepID=UPI001F4D76AE
GIGAAISWTLAQEGAVPVIFGKSPMPADFVAQMGNAPHAFFQLDLTDDAACKRAVADTVQRFGHLDGLVNNAGINDSIGLDAGRDAFV